MPSDLGERSVRFFYTNYRGERSIRTAIPVILRWGSSEWHPRPQWIMTAFDLDKGAERTFALEDCQFITCNAADHTGQITLLDENQVLRSQVEVAKRALQKLDRRGDAPEGFDLTTHKIVIDALHVLARGDVQ